MVGLPPLSELKIGKFEPHIAYQPSMDWLFYYEADASVTEEQESGSNIVLLRCNKTGKVVGVRIENFCTLPHFNNFSTP